jgi:hypothetical protein
MYCKEIDFVCSSFSDSCGCWHVLAESPYQVPNASKTISHAPSGFLRTTVDRIVTITPHVPRNIDSVADTTLTMKLAIGFLCVRLHVYGIWITAGEVDTFADGGVMKLAYAIPFDAATARKVVFVTSVSRISRLNDVVFVKTSMNK